MSHAFSFHPLRNASAAALLGTLLMLGGCGKQHSAAESIALAKVRQGEGNPQAAIVELRNALQQEPGNDVARLLLAEAYLDAGRSVEAEIELKRLVDGGMEPRKTRVPLAQALLRQANYNRVVTEIKRSPDLDSRQNGALAEMRGEAYLGLNQKENAAKEFAQALQDDADNVEAIVGQAQVALAGADFDGARSLLAQALSRSPDLLSALLLKADIARYSDQLADAETTYRAILVKHPFNMAAINSLTYLLIVRGDYDGAATQIEQIRKFANGAPAANYLLAMVEFRKKNFVAARDAIQKSLAAYPGNLQAVMLSGTIEYALGSNELAERLLRQVVATSPGTAYARKVLAMTLMREGRGQEAAEYLEPLGRQSEDPALLSLLGEAYSMGRQYGKATVYFARASEAQPNSGASRLRLGASRLAMGDGDRAMREFESAVELAPDDTRADFALIITQIRRGELDQALASIAAFEKRQPTNPLVSNLKGGAYLGKKDPARARAAFEKAVELEPTFVPAAMNLAALDLRDKKPDAAKARLQSVIDKDPKNVEALVAYSNLIRELGSPVADIVAPLERARVADPKAVEPRVLLVQNLVTSDAKRAAGAANEAFALEPSSPKVLEALGMTQVALGEQGAATITYTRLVQLQPQSGFAHRRLAELYLAASNQVAAGRELRAALEINPKDLDALLMLVKVEGLAGRTTEAMKIARQLETDLPKLPMGFVLEGDIWMAAKKPAQAATAYEHGFAVGRSAPLVLKLHAAYAAAGRAPDGNALLLRWLADHPDDALIRTYYANYSMRQGQTKTAIEQYETVIARDPRQVVALNDLAFLYGQTKDPRAVPIAERAYALAPQDIHVADTFGWLLVEGDQTRRGVEVLAKAVEASPTAYDVRLHLAKGYVKLGDRIRAKQQFEVAASASGDAKQRTEASIALQALEP